MKIFKCSDCSREREVKEDVINVICLCGGEMKLNTQAKSSTKLEGKQ